MLMKRGVKGDNKACFSGNSGIPRGSRGPVGSRGIKGPQGDRGEKGPRGHMGFKGQKGDKGSLGPQGQKGAGTPGSRGSRGYQGDIGLQGSQGSTGPQGIMGAQGSTGAQGSQGSTGTLIKCLEINYFGGSSADDSGRPLSATDGDFWLVRNVGGDLTIWNGGAWNVITTPNGMEFYYFDTGSNLIWSDVINGGVASIDFSEDCQYKDGDKVMDCATGDWYVFNGSQFTLECNLKGDTGPTGAQGAQGDIGVQGSTGVQGEDGVQGSTGVQGEDGVQGITGISAWHDYVRTEVTGPSYTIGLNDEVIGANPEGATGIVITLPLISSIGGSNKRRYVITDEGGNASIDNITIVPTPSDTILGTSSYVLSTDYQTVCLYSNQVDTWLLC